MSRSNRRPSKQSRVHLLLRVAELMPLFIVLIAGGGEARAQDTVCARVKIEIKQELTLERQAFDAEMKINNTTDSSVIENVSVMLKVVDETGAPVPVSDNPNDLSAKFFIRLSQKQNIANVEGTGSLAAKTTAVINWLLIPAPGSAGSTPLGKKYLVGATFRYHYANENHTLDVSPDVITVKPLPLLTLDYFLQQDVIADDPLTAEVEAIEPFTLGVRVKNNGLVPAKKLKIESAQPKIVENSQGLLINFKIIGSYINDAPVQNSLLIDFGDVVANGAATGRWQMETTLAGKFTDFTAKFAHADELGGALTSLLQAANPHFLIRDVRVDLPGRDTVRDFLAQDGDVVRLYESEGTDTVVTERSTVAQLTAGTAPDGTARYRLQFPATAGFAYVKLPDPFNGTKALGKVVRSDAKQMLPENVWLSKTRNLDTKKWEYWLNVFDVNTPGAYDSDFQAQGTTPRAPVLQFVPDRTVQETKQVSFLVEASSPDGKLVTITAAPLPAGATFTAQPFDATAPTVARAVFDWTPPRGAVGNYLVAYTVTDGTLKATRSATISVQTIDPPAGPLVPAIVSPALGAQVTTLRPMLSAQASTHPQDPTLRLQFELYGDEAMTQLVASAAVDKAPMSPGDGAGTVAQPTQWLVPADLADNTRYWWRVRATDGTSASPWVQSMLFVNLHNDAPDRFNLTSPVPSGQVAEPQPLLSWSNAVDKDGDTVSYGVRVWGDSALTQAVASIDGVPAHPSGTSSWRLSVSAEMGKVYWWQVIATDTVGAQTVTAARSFSLAGSNAAPTSPTVAAPLPGATVTTTSVTLVAGNATDADRDALTYVFELDTVESFDSGAKRVSGSLPQQAGGSTSWTVSGLVENTRYHWRVKAQDGVSESAWASAVFTMNAVNDAPSVPTVANPGHGAWTSAIAPVLEVNPATDPDDDTVTYAFQLAATEAMNPVLRSGTSPTTSWTLAPVADKRRYWWRVRAVDPKGKTSAWSAPSQFTVSTETYQTPYASVQVPSQAIAPTESAGRKTVRLSWMGTDVNVAPTVALYYSLTRDGLPKTLIVDGIAKPVGTHAGSIDWDVTNLPVGAYYIHVEVYDGRGVGRATGAGAVVIPSETGGDIVVTPGSSQTVEGRGAAKFKVRLGSEPTASVRVPVASTVPGEGVATPATLTFTASNWNVDQTVTVDGQTDCLSDGSKAYQVLVGKSASLDPAYMSRSGTPVDLVNLDDELAQVRSSNNAGARICSVRVKTSTKVDATTWEYVVDASFGNVGTTAIDGGTAQVIPPAGMVVVDGQLSFGALAVGQTGRSLDTVTVRAQIAPDVFAKSFALQWDIFVR
ncbi:hypothetical protein [Rhizobacter sp. LjRoot28]|uniref:hypothetical protein n=1 Tax=Rhizobacter sp. LjRoot28 TaxID=3342309 RepID=UPI003ED12B26